MREWIYVRIACGDRDRHDADDVLLRYVGPTSRALRADGDVDRFFFLRYLEGGLHLRYRLRATGPAAAGRARRHLLHEGARFSPPLRLDEAQYVPETEKYGGPHGVTVAEAHFTASSDLALSCIERTAGQPARRMMVAMQAFRALIDAAGLDDASRRTMLAAYADYWRHAHRQHTGQWIAATVAGPDTVEWLRAGIATPTELGALIGEMAGPGLDAWWRGLRRHMQRLRSLSAAGAITRGIPDLLVNFAHTFHNRLDLSVADEVMVAEYLLQAAAAPRP